MDQTMVASEATTSQPRTNPGQQGDDGKEDSIRKKSNVRKRTKTGCLTCRKRRIKCDEARPTCNNCIKSKRQCEGYNQRVVFKDPMAFHPGPYGPVYQGPHHLVNQLQTKSSSQGPLAMIAPKPPAFGFPGHTHSNMNFAPHHPGQHPSSHPQIPPTPMPVPVPVPVPEPMPVPPISSTYNFNQSPSSHIQFPQSSDLLPPPAQPAYIKVKQSPREHHPFLMPQDGQSSSAYLKQESQVISSPIDEEISDIVGPQEQTWDYELPEDEASMGESDDETQDPRVILGPVVKRFNANWDTNGTRVRAFSTFAQCNVLSEYTAHAQIRELKDPRMLAIFMHFIKVTGPSMSLYERHPFDHGDDDHFNPAPKATSSKLWSYTFPLISFNHPGLLHAMLALASLQISKLQMVPPTAAMKHYHLALRRISKNVQAHGRRTQPPTLAATLLLAYFEVWSSDHTKWSTHLFGARILFREIPLREMTRQCLPVKRLKQRQKDLEEQDNTHPYFPNYGAKPRGPLLDLDYQFLSQMCGQHVTPEDYGLGEEQIVELNGSTTDRDVEQYENLRDLYWWYCKMDVYQSMLSGAKLFMEFECWTQCPPRAPISKLEAIYGTYDHLMLLLGRLAAFSSKDRSRKQRASRGRAGPSGSPPMFPGMLPTNGKAQVPTGFGPDVGSSPQSDAQDDPDPEASFNSAMQEWEVVHGAFVAFEKALGPEFQPLRPEFTDRRDSPFGASLQYRTFSVAGVWMNFYMGMIYLYRVRPDMPPVPMQAAGLSARQTAGYAAQVGRIAAGLSDDCSQVTEISTMVSAAFIESCFCLFVAGVQYQDDAQRHWLIRRMHDISRLTGWQSAKQIADGCESGWIKAAQLGRGPPYVRSASIGVDVPISVWRNPRRIDRVIQEELDNGIEQRLVLAKSEQAYYALGLLGVEQDLEVLELKDDG